jgi:hypothetical protein
LRHGKPRRLLSKKCKPSSKKFELIKLPSRDFVIFGGDDPEALSKEKRIGRTSELLSQRYRHPQDDGTHPLVDATPRLNPPDPPLLTLAKCAGRAVNTACLIGNPYEKRAPRPFAASNPENIGCHRRT